MDLFEQKQTLNSMEILVDTREQPTERAKQRYDSFGVPYHRATLNFGDYTYNVRVNGEPYYTDNETVIPKFCVVERKMDLDELARCFTHDRKRFEAEFQRAKDAGCRIYLVIENGSWEGILNGAYRSRVSPHAFFASCTAFMVRYNAQILFCREETVGHLIKEVLYRDLKERLENGEI